jgi:hypothetical protein
MTTGALIEKNFQIFLFILKLQSDVFFLFE